MQKTNTPGTAPPPRKRRRECCTDAPCEAGLRNQYFEGKRLTADSFRVEQRYALDRRRLVNRAIHGWGVVYGYALRPAAQESQAQDGWGRILVEPGLALDECGRELLQTGPVLLDVADAILLDAKGARIERPPEGSYAPRAAPAQGADERPQARWLLSVHYAEQSVGPVKVSDPCSCERNEWDQVCETVRFSLQRDCDACCAQFGCELACGCGTGPCCAGQAKNPPQQQRAQAVVRPPGIEGQAPPGQVPQLPGNPVDRGGCGCLCEHLAGLSDTPCGELRELEDPCVHVRADLCHGVPLACVSLREGACDGEWLFDGWIDACGPRRLVKGNDVLFDLLRGCDLTRISAIGWADWHRSRGLIEWAEFETSFGFLDEDALERIRTSRDRHETFPVPTLTYWVEFSRPVRKDTVRADCFSITMLKPEDEGGWMGSYRVPILRTDTSPKDPPDGLVSRATLVVGARWLYDAVKGFKTIFDEDPVTVEIEIRGDLILDCNGQAVDANAHGLFPAPTGNGTPGGTFYSRFQVQPRLIQNRVADDSADRTAGVES
jgi:hypothetical protein